MGIAERLYKPCVHTYLIGQAFCLIQTNKMLYLVEFALSTIFRIVFFSLAKGFPKSATKAHMLPLGLVHCLWPHTQVSSWMR